MTDQKVAGTCPYCRSGGDVVELHLVVEGGALCCVCGEVFEVNAGGAFVARDEWEGDEDGGGER